MRVDLTLPNGCSIIELVHELIIVNLLSRVVASVDWDSASDYSTSFFGGSQ